MTGRELPGTDRAQIAETISDQIAAIHVESYGMPVRHVTTHVLDDLVVVLLEIDLTRIEQQMIKVGRGALVHELRHAEQEADAKAVVERATGRRVVAFASDTQLDPPFVAALFRLDPSTVDRSTARPDDSAADQDEACRRDIRQRATSQREQIAQARLDAARKRDAIAHARDRASVARHRAADERDLEMAQRDAAYAQDIGEAAVTVADILTPAAEQRALAAQDRRAAAQDSEQADRDRRHALADREALARQLAIAETDPLTGARTRAAGLTDLDRELDRCRRTSSLLVVAYVDVVGLKLLNDSEGHGAGDELLKRVVALIKEHLRSYDLIVRLGGDEFLCAMSGTTLLEAHERFSTIATAFAAAPNGGAITTGFAELTPGETAEELIARADGELIDRRRGDHNRRQAPADDTSDNRAR